MWRDTISKMQSHLDPDQILDMVTSSLDSDKAEDVLSIPLGGKSSVADYMVIASGSSSRQVAAMAEQKGTMSWVALAQSPMVLSPSASIMMQWERQASPMAAQAPSAPTDSQSPAHRQA